MVKSIEEIDKEAFEELEKAASPEDVESLSIKYLGRKGLVTTFLRNISKLPENERPSAGKNANLLKVRLGKAFKEAVDAIKSNINASDDFIDVTLPGRSMTRGHLHPVTKITREISDIFLKLGFDIAEGPEVETDYYNFEALNIPKYHPARDM